jgi:hypothetical protein
MMTWLALYTFCGYPVFVWLFILYQRRLMGVTLGDLFSILIVSMLPILREVLLLPMIVGPIDLRQVVFKKK